MAKNDKKIKVLETRIKQLEVEIEEARKTRNRGFDIPAATTLINQLKQDIKRLK